MISPPPIPVIVKDGMLGITDINGALFDIQGNIKSARYKIRDEQNRMTWVYDRLLGLTVDNCVNNCVYVDDCV